MISLSAALPDQAPLSGQTSRPGKSGAPSVSGAPGPISAETQSAISGTFASLLETGITRFPAPTPRAAPTMQDGKVLPDGNMPGKILPIGTDLPPLIETPVDTPIEPTLSPAARPDAEKTPQSEAPVAPLTSASAALPPPIVPTLSTPPTPQAASAKPQVQTPQVIQQAKPGVSPARQLAGSAEPSAPAASTSPVPQIISTTSTRDALDMPRAMMATAMPTTPLATGDPVMATGLTSSTATPPAPDAMTQNSLAPRDFEALIDRLAQARETAQPSTARVSLPHAEFGQVNLRFDASASSMTVTMTSQDPDFALAARTALAERAVMAPDQSRNEANSGRNDNGNNGNGQTHGQAQNQAQNQPQGQMHSQARPASNNADRSPEHDAAFDPENPVNDQTTKRWAENRGLFA